MEKNLSDQVFVAGLEWGVDDDQLKAFFEGNGLTVVSAVVVKSNGRSKGFGFVTFGNAEDASRALDLNGQMLENRAIVVKPKEARSPRPRY